MNQKKPQNGPNQSKRNKMRKATQCQEAEISMAFNNQKRTQNTNRAYALNQNYLCLYVSWLNIVNWNLSRVPLSLKSCEKDQNRKSHPCKFPQKYLNFRSWKIKVSWYLLKYCFANFCTLNASYLKHVLSELYFCIQKVAVNFVISLDNVNSNLYLLS